MIVPQVGPHQPRAYDLQWRLWESSGGCPAPKTCPNSWANIRPSTLLFHFTRSTASFGLSPGGSQTKPDTAISSTRATTSAFSRILVGEMLENGGAPSATFLQIQLLPQVSAGAGEITPPKTVSISMGSSLRWKLQLVVS